jgi:hypothetical protein
MTARLFSMVYIEPFSMLVEKFFCVLDDPGFDGLEHVCDVEGLSDVDFFSHHRGGYTKDRARYGMFRFS